MKFVQFRLHSIIPSYNYFVYNSVNKLLIFSNANSTGRWVGGEGAGVVVSFSKIRTFARGIPPQREGERGRSKKRQFYGIVIIESPPNELYFCASSKHPYST